jgi:hypothetical protein
MNTQLIKLISKVTLLGAVMILTSVASVKAQTLADRPRFTIPFDFVFGEKQLPAGKYSIGRAMPNSGDIMLTIADRDGRSKAVVLSNAAVKSSPNTRATLVFHRYGDQYFLAQVWPAGAVHGREFPRTKLERELRKQQQVSIVRIPVDR